MSTLFVSNEPYNFSNFTVSTSTTFFDSDYVDKALGLDAVGGQVSNCVFQHEASSGDTTWYHFRVYLDSFSGSSFISGFADGELWRARDASGNLLFQVDVVDGTWRIEVFGTSSPTGSSFTPSEETATDFDIKITINDGSGNNVVELYQNGVLISSATVANDGEGNPVEFDFYHSDISSESVSGRDVIYYSEIIVSEDSTVGARLAKLDPTTDGDLTDWTGGASDVSDSDISTRITSNTNGDEFSANIGSYSGASSPSSIRSVIVTSLGSRGVSGPTNLQHLLRIGSTNYNGASISLTTSPTAQLTEWTTDPSDSGAWAVADLSSLQIGVEAVT